MSRGSVTYGVAKVFVKILRPLVGNPPHNIHSIQDFVNMVSKVTLLPGECLYSYDVTELFISVPIDSALNIIKDLLKQDTTLWDRTELSLQSIIDLLGFCLHNTFFSSQDNFYEQVEGAAMGSLVSSIVADFYMEYFERKALHTTSNPQALVKVIDDTLSSNKRPINNYFWNT